MAINFPTDPSESPWTNPTTNEIYEWNTTSNAWRRKGAAEGGGGPLIPDLDGSDHQTGTLDDRYVEVSGDTMTGDLIQTPSEDAYPTSQGEMSTAVVGESEIEFRFMNSNDKVVCASLELTPCAKTVYPVISIDGSAEVFADFGEDLILVSDGDVPNATMGAQSWESSEDGTTWTVVGSATPPDPYTVQITDKGKLFRVAQAFFDDDTNDSTTIYSNAISVTNEAPPITEWIGWTHSGGNAALTITRTAGADSALVFKNEGGDWVQKEEVRTLSSDLAPGTYIIQADILRSFSFVRSDSSISLTLSPQSYTTNLQTMANAFQTLTRFNQDLTGFDWSNVTNWSDAFYGCTSYNSNVAGLIGAHVTDISRMFLGSGFNQPVSSWNVSGVRLMTGLFENSPFDQPLTTWNTSNVESFAAMFMGTTEFNQSVDSFDISSAQDMSAMFRDAEKYNKGISSWVFPVGANVAGMFAYTKEFNSSLTFDTSNLTSLFEMFEGAEKFNHDSINGWNVGNVVNLSKTFKHSSFNRSLNGWNTGNVEDMSRIFANAKVFNSDIESWNVSKVSNFHSAFYQAEVFNQDLNNWNTSSAVVMESMFYATRVFNKPLDKWNTANVDSMNSMFRGSWKFNQDLSSWCVPLISSSPVYFSESTDAGFRDVPNDKHPIWGTCPPRILTNPVIK